MCLLPSLFAGVAGWVDVDDDDDRARRLGASRRFRPQRSVLGWLSAVALVCCLPQVVAAQVNKPDGPRAVADRTSIDLGEVAKGEVFDLEFQLRNEGVAPLLLADTRSSCGCTVLDWDQEVAPGESGSIRVRLDTRTVSGDAQTDVRVQTNDPEHAEFEFSVQVKVVDYVGLHPPRARWDTVQGEAHGTIGVTLFSLDGGALIVNEVEASRSDIGGAFRPASEEERVAGFSGEQWRVELSLLAEPAVGAIDGYAAIKIDHAKQSVVFLPTSGFVRPLVHVAPEVRDLGEIVLGDDMRQARYEVRNFGSRPMQIARVEIEGIEGATAEVQSLKPGFIYNVLLRFDPETVAAGAFDGRLIVHTDLERRRTVEIPARGTVALE